MKRLFFAPTAFAAIVAVTACYAKDRSLTASEVTCNSTWSAGKTEDLSCVPFTEKLMQRLRFALRKDVIKAMHAEGRPRDHDGLHFTGVNYDAGGDINVLFKDGRAMIIFGDADTDGTLLSYTWNAKLGSCSDFPGSKELCRTMNPLRHMILEGITDCELDDVVNAAAAHSSRP